MKKIILGLMLVFLLGSVSAVKNPSAVYCEEMGYEFTIHTTREGDVGICTMPNGRSFMAWEFLKGKIGKEYSYCGKQGYELKTINDSEKCPPIFSEECAVCVLSDGREVEMTQLMDLDFTEERCGDGACSFGESHGNCPEDCPSGGRDSYCDGLDDLLCDPDCPTGEDPDCATETTTTTVTSTTESIPASKGGDNSLAYILVLVVVFVAGFLIYRRYREGKEMEDAREKREGMVDWIEEQLRNGEDPKKLKTVVRSQGFEEKLVDYVEKKIY